MLGRIIIIVFDIILVFGGIFLISRYQAWFTKHRLKIISALIVLGICLYSIGYMTNSQGPLGFISSGLMAIFSTGRMFVLENDISSFESNLSEMPLYNVVFGLIMAFSMLVTGMIVLSLLGYRVMSKLQLGFIRCFMKNRKVYIFTELNENSLNLANDIKKYNENSIIIICVNANNDSDDSTRLEMDASKSRHLIHVVYDTPDAIDICLKLMKFKAYIFAISEDIYNNVSFVDQYGEEIKKMKKRGADVSLYAFVDYDNSADAFCQNVYPQLNLHIIDVNDLASRQLFDHFTLLSTLSEDKVLTVAIIGFTEICENLYRNVIFLSQRDGVRVKLILIEEDIKDKAAVFIHKNPEIEKCASFEYINTKPDTDEYYKALTDHLDEINCIMVVTNHIGNITEVSRHCLHNNSNVQICAYLKDYEKYKCMLNSPLLNKIIYFGSSKEIFTENHIINETLDQLAKQCHYYYTTVYNSNKKWEEISLFEKQSNRALALHFQSKLYTVGLRYEKGGNADIYEELMRDHIILDSLAKGEHLRWNAYHFVNGWRTMNDIHAKDKNKNERLKVHSCLVDWDELDQVGSVFDKDFKLADRLLVQNVGNILTSAGFGIIRND